MTSALRSRPSDADGGTWAGSSRGQAVDITAPGESVWTAGWDLTTETPHVGQASGTSHAVAHLAGVAALWLAYHGADNLRARYGGNLQWAFLRSCSRRARRPWAGTPCKYGPGIVNAKALRGTAADDAVRLRRPGAEPAVARARPPRPARAHR